MWALNSIKRLRGRGNSSIELLEESLQSRNTGYCYSIETDQTNTRLTNHVCVQTPVLTQSTNLAQYLPCNVWQVWQQSLSHFMTKGYRRNFLLSWCTSCRNYFSCCLTTASALMHTEKQPSVQHQTKPKFTCNSVAANPKKSFDISAAPNDAIRKESKKSKRISCFRKLLM